ncbi:MAG: hypothetical protein ACE5D0_00810 [Fidelibacterota bacterium]
MTELDFTNQTELHKYFSGRCYNKAWELIDKTDRNEGDTEEMVHYALASLFHWSKRKDCTIRHKSIGCWQVSRCYTLAGNIEQAERYGKLCLEFSKNEEPFYLGYAHEALARVHTLTGNREEKEKHLKIAKDLTKIIRDKEEKELLLADLRTIN